MSCYVSVLVSIAIVGLVQATRWTKPVNTTQGLVRGLFAEDGDYSMYLGIPYAKVNKENPFGAADPHPPFDNVFDATNDSVMCPQENEFDKKISGTLDCLHIHISVPNTNKTKLPVLVYIFGGYLTIGFAGRYSYGGRLLVKHDIIVVSFNYRLGAYGFMCLDTEEMPGNQGLRDQYLALKWIKKNIEAFGGDPDKVTVMGNSAGSMSIDFHLLSDFPTMFHQGILESGVALVPELVVSSDSTVPFKLSKYLGFETDNMTEAISFLATVHPHRVVAATINLNIVTRVCVEKKFENVEQFLSVHPENVEKYDMKDINILGGFNENELIYFFHKTDFKESFFRDYIGRSYRVEDMENMVRFVRRFYIGDEMVTKEVKQKIIDFASDMSFIHPIQRTFTKYMRSGAKVHQYLFTYDGGRNFEKVLEGVNAKGASHADELGYLFDMVMFSDTPTPEDQYVIDVMTMMWANFVKYGNPTPVTSELIPVMWRPASIDVIHYLEINSNLTTGVSPFHERLSFWDMFTFVNRDKLLINKETAEFWPALPSTEEVTVPGG